MFCLSEVFESLHNRKKKEGIYLLTTLYLTISMAPDLDALLVIFWLSLLTLSHFLEGVSFKFLLLP